LFRKVSDKIYQPTYYCHKPTQNNLKQLDSGCVGIIIGKKRRCRCCHRQVLYNFKTT
jgi:hypothetical protein